MDEALVRRLSDRADLAGIALPDSLRGSLVAYFNLLFRWNAKINLTSLAPGDEAIDRLLLEPVAAAAALPGNARIMDLGSGGGSPAIPLALASDAADLVMVESRGRKATFLREAAQVLGLRARVETARFEDLSSGGNYRCSADVVAMRAVRMDVPALKAAATFLDDSGVLALFVSAGAQVPGLTELPYLQRTNLLPGGELIMLSPDVPRGTVANHPR